MGRKPIDADRRQKIVDATLNCIHKYGYQDTTVARICADAGLSTGNIHYYFGGKQNLLEEAMRSLLRDIRRKMVISLNEADSPSERLAAILRSNFHPDIFRTDICITWLHFWAQAPHTSELARLEHVNRRRFEQNLAYEFMKLKGREEARSLVHQTVAMVDGLWVKKAQRNVVLTAEDAFNLVMSFVEKHL